MKIREEMRLCLKAVMLWEALRGKGFSLLDLNDPEDATALMYAMVSYRGDIPHTLEEFTAQLQEDGLGERLGAQMLQHLVRSGSVPTHALATDQQQPTEQADDGAQGSGVYLGKMATMLIAQGWSASYVLYQMELWELNTHVEACVAKKREEMERDRLWVYHLLLPHIDSNKVKSPQDMFPFAWERNRERAELEEQAELYSLLSRGGIRMQEQEL